MSTDLVDTDSAAINAAIVEGRMRNGMPATGMVLSLVIDTEEGEHYDSLRAAVTAARAHPARILVHIARAGRERARLDAEIRTAGESGPGEIVLLRTHGELSKHAAAVVLPLLLPDAPVVAWWPGTPPPSLCDSELGRLAQRRISDSAVPTRSLAALRRRAETYCPGDTDLTWTRATTWRTMLASALDEPFDGLHRVRVEAERSNPTAELLALWLADRLGVEVAREVSKGPGITAVTMSLRRGELSLHRPDGRLAILSRPGQPDRSVALPRRETADLLAEELRRLDPDDVFGRILCQWTEHDGSAEPEPAKTRSTKAGSGTIKPKSSRTRTGPKTSSTA